MPDNRDFVVAIKLATTKCFRGAEGQNEHEKRGQAEGLALVCDEKSHDGKDVVGVKVNLSVLKNLP